MAFTPAVAARVRRAGRRRIAGTFAVLAVVVLVTSIVAGAPAASGQDPGLTVEALREGGYVIFFRHVLADDGTDMTPVNLDDCTTQRNIRETGLRDARTIGNAFRMLAIPVGSVYTSEICRARETAGLAFGRIDAEVPALNLCCIDGLPLSGEARNQFIERAVALVPPHGTNTVIVAHGVGIVADLGQGEAAIYKPDGIGGAVRVARVLPDEWLGGVYRPGGPRSGGSTDLTAGQ